MRKYEFTGETKIINLCGKEVTLHRIKAVIEFGLIKVGEVGGWIEKESNLSHDDKSWVYGNAKVWGNAKVYGNAKVSRVDHILVIGPAGSRNDFTTFYRDKDNEITVKCGCFLGKIDKFLEKVTQTHKDNKYAIVYRASAELAKLQIDLSEESEENE